MSRKDEYLDHFSHLEAAVDSGQVPEALTPMLRSIKAKLLAEKARYLESFENKDGRTQLPSMGIIESYAEKTEDLEYFFGTDIRSRNRIRIILSQASVDEDTGKIHKEGVISEVVMTEAQFGDIIGSQNRGMGLPVTQTLRFGVPVEEYTPADDITKQNAGKTLADANKDPGVLDALGKVRSILEESQDKGRVKAADAKEVARDLRSSVSNVKSNTGFQIDRISELYANKTALAALNIHLDASSIHRPLLTKDTD